LKRPEPVVIAGDQPALAVVDEGERAKAVELQLEDLVLVVERLCEALQKLR
jgi:hypothetical protein